MTENAKTEKKATDDSVIDYKSFPKTRFLGSKLKLIPWINDSIRDLKYNTVLDAFGGSASFSYLMKKKNKQVYFNDLLKFNQDIATAIIENNRVKLSKEDIQTTLSKKPKSNLGIIQKNFNNIYFKESENKWLDDTVTRINSVQNKYKKALLLSAVYQSCLIKRPFNLFHRNNLKIRTRRVERNFGNKITWEKPFSYFFTKFSTEYSAAVFDNHKKNKVLGGYDALSIPEKEYDLVYIDPPYLSKKSKINYLDCYHFLEGVGGYKEWISNINFDSKNKKFKERREVNKWVDKKEISNLFEELITKYRNSNIIFSYRNDGIPSIPEIKKLFIKNVKKNPVIKYRDYKYALSNGSTKEVLFIHKV